VLFLLLSTVNSQGHRQGTDTYLTWGFAALMRSWVAVTAVRLALGLQWAAHESQASSTPAVRCLELAVTSDELAYTLADSATSQAGGMNNAQVQAPLPFRHALGRISSSADGC
jgi:hypothetical protein